MDEWTKFLALLSLELLSGWKPAFSDPSIQPTSSCHNRTTYQASCSFLASKSGPSPIQLYLQLQLDGLHVMVMTLIHLSMACHQGLLVLHTTLDF
jgi:hypothetical protein